MQLQPRGLANLLLTVAVLGLWHYVSTGSAVAWALLVALGVVLLLLHKMTAQMWAVCLVGFGLWARNWTVPALLPASVLAAIVLSKGFYVRVLRAHWDIVSFWHRNIRFLGSHQYYESPLYHKEGFVSTALHQPGLRNWLGKLRAIAKANVFAALAALLGIAALRAHQGGLVLPAGPEGGLESFLWWWLLLTYLWALVTTFVPGLKALGAGVYYVYQSYCPLFLLAALACARTQGANRLWLLGPWGLLLLVSAWWYWRYLRSLADAGAGDRADLRAVLEHLRGLPGDGVLCIPLVLSDPTAYLARKRVLWGGHGYGFNAKLAPYFPVAREDVPRTLADKNLDYVLFQRGYLESLQEAGLVEGEHVARIHERGPYALYAVIKEGPRHAEPAQADQ
jgi:hypothetical protein